MPSYHQQPAILCHLTVIQCHTIGSCKRLMWKMMYGRQVNRFSVLGNTHRNTKCKTNATTKFKTPSKAEVFHSSSIAATCCARAAPRKMFPRRWRDHAGWNHENQFCKSSVTHATGCQGCFQGLNGDRFIWCILLAARDCFRQLLWRLADSAENFHSWC